MADAWAYEGSQQHDSQDAEAQKQIARCVSKLKGSSRTSQLRVLAGLLEQLPQDVEALGPSQAREVLLGALADKAVLHSKQKDVRMYAAACFAQLLRIWAPETPYEDKQLEVGHTEMLGRCCRAAPTATGNNTRQGPMHADPAALVDAPTLWCAHYHVLFCTACSPCLTCCCGA